MGGGVTYALEASANEVDTNKEWNPEGSIVAQGEDGVPWELYENGYLLFKPESGKNTLTNSKLLDTTSKPSWKSLDVKAIGFTDKVYLPEDSSYLFANSNTYGSTSAEFLEASKIDTSKVKNMNNMFTNSSFLKLDLNTWDTSNVEDMSYMFYQMDSVTKLDLNTLDTSKVKNMSSMFYQTSYLKELNIQNWNTSNVEDMRNMFDQSIELTKLDLNKWNVSKVKDMSYMFDGLVSLEELNISNWDTSNVEDMSGMFNEVLQLKELNISNWNTNKVKDMSNMFAIMRSVEKLDLNKWNTLNVESMGGMFGDTPKLRYLDITNFDTSKVNNLEYMFSNSGIIKLKIGDKFARTQLTNGLFKTLDFEYIGELLELGKKYGHKWTRLDKTTSFYTVDEWNKEYRANPDKLAGMWVREKDYNGYDIIFETDTDETINPIEVEIGTNVELPTPSVLKPNHSFVGWSKTQDGEVIVDTTNLGKKNETVTLYAKWKKNQTEDNSTPSNAKPLAPKDDENKTNNITNNASTTPILPPTVDKPEYTGTLSTNTPVDNNGDLILPPIHNKEEYTQPIGTNTPIDNDGNLILPPIVNILEYKNKIEKQKNANEKRLQPVTDNTKPKIKTNINIDDKKEITTNNADKSESKQNAKETNIDIVNKTEPNETVIQKQTLPKTNTLHSTAYILGLLLSTVGFTHRKKD